MSGQKSMFLFAFAFAAMACGHDDSSDRTKIFEASVGDSGNVDRALDADTDASVLSSLCVDTDRQWRDLVDAHEDCVLDTDCDQIDTIQSCNVPDGVQVAVRKDSLEMLEGFSMAWPMRATGCSGPAAGTLRHLKT